MMVSLRNEEEMFEEDVVLDHEQLLNNYNSKMRTAINRISSGKCTLFTKTLGLCAAFFGLGLSIVSPGYTFTSITEIKKFNFSPLADLFISRSFGYLMGCSLAGCLFDRYNRLFLLFISLLLTSVLITLIPWCQLAWLIHSTIFALGVSLGFLYTGGNVLCLDLWGHNSGPFMQALHFSFALGVMVAPLLSVSSLQTNTSVLAITTTQPHLRTVRLVNSSSEVSRKLRPDWRTSDGFDRVSTEITNYPSSSTIPSSLTTKRTPKPKPKITDAAKLDRSQDWEKVPVRKPPLEDLMPLNITPPTHIPSLNSTQIAFSLSSVDARDQFISGPNKSNISSKPTNGKITKEVYPKSSSMAMPMSPVSNSTANSTFISKLNAVLVKSSCNENNVSKIHSKSTQASIKMKQLALNMTATEIQNIVLHSNNFSQSSGSIKDTSKEVTHRPHRLKPGTYDNDTEDINPLFGLIASRIEEFGFDKNQSRYLMVGLFVFIVSLGFLGFLYSNPRDPKSKQGEHKTGLKTCNKVARLSLIFLISCLFFLCIGLVKSFSQLTVLYTIHGPLTLSPSSAANLPSVFWASFTAMRFTAIFLASGLSPASMLLLNILFFSSGTLLLSIIAHHFESALWLGSILSGVGLATIVPSGILWLERYIHVSNKIATILLMSASLGEIICPLTLHSFTLSGRALLLSVNACAILICTLLYFLTSQTEWDKGYQLANQTDEEEIINMAIVHRQRSRMENGTLLLT